MSDQQMQECYSFDVVYRHLSEGMPRKLGLHQTAQRGITLCGKAAVDLETRSRFPSRPADGVPFSSLPFCPACRVQADNHSVTLFELIAETAVGLDEQVDLRVLASAMFGMLKIADEWEVSSDGSILVHPKLADHIKRELQRGWYQE